MLAARLASATPPRPRRRRSPARWPEHEAARAIWQRGRAATAPTRASPPASAPLVFESPPSRASSAAADRTRAAAILLQLTERSRLRAARVASIFCRRVGGAGGSSSESHKAFSAAACIGALSVVGQLRAVAGRHFSQLLAALSITFRAAPRFVSCCQFQPAASSPPALGAFRRLVDTCVALCPVCMSRIESVFALGSVPGR